MVLYEIKIQKIQKIQKNISIIKHMRRAACDVRRAASDVRRATYLCLPERESNVSFATHHVFAS